MPNTTKSNKATLDSISTHELFILQLKGETTAQGAKAEMRKRLVAMIQENGEEWVPEPLAAWKEWVRVEFMGVTQTDQSGEEYQLAMRNLKSWFDPKKGAVRRELDSFGLILETPSNNRGCKAKGADEKKPLTSEADLKTPETLLAFASEAQILQALVEKAESEIPFLSAVAKIMTKKKFQVTRLMASLANEQKKNIDKVRI